jgi:hypothetical protein
MRALRQSRPLLLIGATLSGWVLLRGGYLAWLPVAIAPPGPLILPPIVPWEPERPVAVSPAPAFPRLAAASLSPIRSGPFTVAIGERGAQLVATAPPLKPDALPMAGPIGPDPVIAGNQMLLRRMLAFRQPSRSSPSLQSSLLSAQPDSEAFPPARAAPGRHWTLAGWVLLRPGQGGAGLGRTGLSGSQAGMRLSWRPGDGPVTAFARVNSAGRLNEGAELALGTAVRPVANVPVDVIIERRIGVAGPGRDAFAAYASGGGATRLPRGDWRIDSYGAAGVVGARRRDLFVEGTMRVDRPVGQVGPLHVRAGGAVWGASQTGASRLDAGPSITARPSTSSGSASVSIDWRQRLTGNAAPASGPAVTVSMNF